MGYRFEEDKVQPVIVVEPRSDGFSAFAHDDYVINGYITFAGLSGRSKIEIPLVGPVNAFYPESDLLLVGPGTGVAEIIQPFVVDQDNVYSFSLPVKGVSVYTLVEDFERYGNTNQLRAVWVPSDPTNTPNVLATGGGFDSKYMQMTITRNRSAGDSIRRTFAPDLLDWSYYTGVQLRLVSNYTYMQFRIIDDMGSIAYVTLPNVGATPTTVYFPFTSFWKVGANFPDLSIISAIEFYCAYDYGDTTVAVDDITVVRLPNINMKCQFGEVRFSPFSFVPLVFDDGMSYRPFNVTLVSAVSSVIDITRGIWNRAYVLDKGKVYGVRLYDFSEAYYIGVNGSSPYKMRVLSGGNWVEHAKNVAFIQSSELRNKVKNLHEYSVVVDNFVAGDGTMSGFLVKDGSVKDILFVNQVPGNIGRSGCNFLVKDERVSVELNPFVGLVSNVTLQVLLKYRVEKGG